MRPVVFRLSLLLALFLFLGVLGFGWHQLNAGFNLHKLYCTLPDNLNWKISYTQEEKENVRKILGQEFSYLGKGRQAFVFVSEDQKYVIKFFRYHLLKPKFWYYFVRGDKQREYIESRKNKLEAWMESFKLAYEKVREENGLIYLHLVKTSDLSQKLIIKDRIGLKYEIDLDKAGYLVQKRTDLFFDTVRGLVKAKDSGGLNKVLSAYVKNLASRHQKGLWDRDHSWTDNTGNVSLDEVYEIDVGRYSFRLPAAKEEELLNSLLFYTKPLRVYLEQEMPSILPSFDQEVERVSHSFFPVKDFP